MKDLNDEDDDDDDAPVSEGRKQRISSLSKRRNTRTRLRTLADSSDEEGGIFERKASGDIARLASKRENDGFAASRLKEELVSLRNQYFFLLQFRSLTHLFFGSTDDLEDLLESQSYVH